ncbi:leucine-rich repeat-containing protein 46-like [Plakobranchus ocellatus]|uniref:Leucine-rich repeat-containing protein 46-like n=1 Tax=Plakobranchus ocellatus TaxID=259542 RepID=A0AAV3XX11_9GAST|nr:leucine-rich repeat-containing protein 46-like [Plakobranchus ocellatus]
MDAASDVNQKAEGIGVEREESSELIDSAPEKKPIRLSLHLIVKRHLPEESTNWSQEKIINELNKIKRVRLDRESIGEIDSLELFSTQVTNLYLQSNKICNIQNLECLPNLQVLVLSSNRIRHISGINHLEKLVFLDLSENCLESINSENLPKNIIILNLAKNPLLEETDYRPDIIQSLPKLKQLDGTEVSVKEKVTAGVLVDWDEAEEDEEEEVEESMSESDEALESRGPFVLRDPDSDLSMSSLYKQLPKIETSIQGFAADMLLRSQERLEDVAKQHKRHLQQITNIKIKSKIKPMPQISKPQ